MDITLNLIGLISFFAINIIGWVYTVWKSGNIASKQRGKYEEKLNNVIKEVDELPCKANPHFHIDTGSMIQKMNDLDRRLGRIEEFITDRIKSCEDDIRSINMRMNSRI